MEFTNERKRSSEEYVKAVVELSSAAGLDLKKDSEVNETLYGKTSQGVKFRLKNRIPDIDYFDCFIVDLRKKFINPIFSGIIDSPLEKLFKACSYDTSLFDSSDETTRKYILPYGESARKFYAHVINYEVVYEKATRQLKKSNDVIGKPAGDYIVGAELIKIMLDSIRKDSLLIDFLQDHIGKNRANVQVVQGERPNAIWVVDDFYLADIEMTPQALRKLQLELSGFTGVSAYAVKKAFIQRPELFYNMIIEDIVCEPKGYREPFKGAFKPIINTYNSLIADTHQLNHVLTYKESTLSTLIGICKKIDTHLENIMVKAPENKNNKGDYKPILESVTRKEGLIRGEMLATRIDYSGRAGLSVDPNLDLGTAGIPRVIARKIFALNIIDLYYEGNIQRFIEDPNVDDKVQQYIDEHDPIIVVGRQPTLHRFSLPGVRPVLTDNKTISIPPTMAPALNADYDGDKVLAFSAVTKRAREDMDKLALINNMRYDKDGEVHNLPGMEVIYALHYLPNIKPEGKQVNVTTLDDAIAKLQTGEWKLKDAVGGESLAVYLAKEILEVDELPEHITKGFVADIIDYQLLTSNELAAKMIDRIYRLSFEVAKTYPVKLTLSVNGNVDNYREEMKQELRELSKYRDYGIISEDQYSNGYSETVFNTQKKMVDYIEDSYPNESNGFFKLSESKAKCTPSSLQQMFYMRGLLMMNKTQPFNAVVSKGLSDRLTSLEYFCTAYGARQGIEDKVLETSKPGYLTRQAVHSAYGAEITEEDCGTKIGIPLTRERMCYYSMDELPIDIDDFFHDPSSDFTPIKNLIKDITHGRYVFISGVEKYILKDEDYEMILQALIADKDIFLRSPITCKNPVCKHCYGMDMGSNQKKLPKVGLRIGYRAAAAISEPSTQLTMKNFQGGNAAGRKNLMSSFSMLEKLWRVQDLDIGDVKATNVISTGKPYHSMKVDGNVEVIFEGERKKQTFIDCVTRDNAPFGEPVIATTLIKDVKQVEMVLGSVEAAIEQVFSLYRVYNVNVTVNLKHFETIFSELIYYTYKKDLMKSYNRRHLKENGFKDPIIYDTKTKRLVVSPEYISSLIGINFTMMANPNAFRGILTERLKESIIKSVLIKRDFDMNDILVRQAFGRLTDV